MITRVAEFVMEGRRSRNRKSAKRRRAQSSERNRDAKKGKSEPSSSSFLEKMKARLSGGHFRMINEKLYTCTGEEALNYFKEDPSLFNMYHAGYQAQMSQWPEQPVHKIIEWLQVHSPSLIVADFGCGDARVAKSVKNKVFSFDLVSNDPDVIAGDMSNRCVLWIRFGHHFPLYTNISLLRTIQTTYLDSSSVDVAIFCLSLMGINYPNYVREAHRVLKPSGWLLIAEVKSRLDPKTGGADPNKFIKAVCELGFTPLSKDFTNKMFVLFHFTKQEKPSSKREEITWPELKPCIYKRR